METNKRYTINISFRHGILENNRVQAIVEKVKTFKEAMSYEELIDDTVLQALIKDNITGKIIWLRK